MTHSNAIAPTAAAASVTATLLAPQLARPDAARGGAGADDTARCCGPRPSRPDASHFECRLKPAGPRSSGVANGKGSKDTARACARRPAFALTHTEARLHTPRPLFSPHAHTCADPLPCPARVSARNRGRANHEDPHVHFLTRTRARAGAEQHQRHQRRRCRPGWRSGPARTRAPPRAGACAACWIGRRTGNA